MNLIVDRRLGQAERRLIQELTLKKRQSKKAHMSEKQVLARQQLADELLQLRKTPGALVHTRSHCLHLPHHHQQITTTTTTSRPQIRQTHSSASLLKHQHLVHQQHHLSHEHQQDHLDLLMSTSSLYQEEDEDEVDEGNHKTLVGTSASHCDHNSSYPNHNINHNHHHHHHQHRRHPVSSLGSSSSFSRSDSSYSVGSHDSGGLCPSQMHMILEQRQQQQDQQQQQLTSSTTSPTAAAATTADTSAAAASSSSMVMETTTIDAEEPPADDDKEASIKFNKSRLERLNKELEKRLYQYEYLVAREKHLLGAHNLMLFTSEGVNNFAY